MTDKAVSSFLSTTLGTCKKAFIYVGIFSFFENLLILTVPLYMLQIFDRVVISHSHETLFYLTLLAMVALATLGALDIVRSYLLIKLSHWLDNHVSPEAMRKSADELLQGRTYPSLSLRDVQQVRSFIASSQIFALFDIPWAPVFLVVIFLLHVSLGWMSVIGAILLLSLAVINELYTRSLFEAAQKANFETQAHVNAMMRNAEVIQAMGLMEGVIAHWVHKNKIVVNLSTKGNFRTGFILGLSKFFRLALQVGMLGFGAYLVIENEITAGVMVTASILLTRAYAPIDQSISAWKLFISARMAYQRLTQYFLQPIIRPESRVLQAPNGVLSIEEAGYTPPGKDKAILNHIHFKLDKGKLLVIIGPSGAGKTTLARLLVGVLAPTKGTIVLDNASVYTWERQDFGKHIGYLPQDLELFIGTVEDNIGRMQTVSKESIVTASRMVGAHEFILRLPQGYLTYLHDAGLSLSGGQRQQIALARAVLNNPPLLVLDEPTTFLDNHTQELLFQNLQLLKQRGSIIVVVTHNMAFIKRADNILFLEQGEINLFGSTEQVLQKIQQKNNVTRKS